MLPKALWDYRITWKDTTSFTPYELMYGKHVVLLLNLKFKTLRIDLQIGMKLSDAQKHQLNQLNELDEIRQDAIHQEIIVQQPCAKWHDNFIKNKKFKEGDWAPFPILDTIISKVNYTLDGWDHMRLKPCLIMGLFDFVLSMRHGHH